MTISNPFATQVNHVLTRHLRRNIPTTWHLLNPQLTKYCIEVEEHGAFSPIWTCNHCDEHYGDTNAATQAEVVVDVKDL